MKKQCGYLLLYVVVAVLLLPLLLTMLCGGLGQELPQEAQDYVAFIEDLAHTRVTFIGVGADREQIINRFWK